MDKFSPSKVKRTLGISYLGCCDSSPKLVKSVTHKNVLTYGLYLAPRDLSGYNVCSNSDNCCKYCLNGSGRNKIELLTYKEGGLIQRSRIKKNEAVF